MKKNFWLFFLLSALTLYTLDTDPVRAATSTISTCGELQSVSTTITDHTYLLLNDIDCAGGSFTPITDFHATLDGDGFTIRNVSIPQPTPFINYQGIFRSLTGATIRNVHIRNASVVGNFQMGILAAGASLSKISNVTIQGTAQSTASLSVLGGVVGKTWNTVLENVSTTVSLQGYSLIGGLIGEVSESTTVQFSSAHGTINASGNDIGGLIGAANTINARNTYAQVTISGGGNRYGGLVGSLNGSDTIDRSLAASPVSSAGSSIGGLIGYASTSATTTASYWDTQASGKSSSDGGTGTTTTALYLQTTYIGWDFTNDWQVQDAHYPTIKKIDVQPPVIGGAFGGTGFTSSTAPRITWPSITESNPAYRAYGVEWSRDSDFTDIFYTTTTAESFTTPTTTLDPGRYYVRLTVRDLFANLSTATSSTPITVDIIAPSLFLYGEADMALTTGENFTDPGAFATDTLNGGIPSEVEQIDQSGTVSTSVVGTYTITYSVRDSAGNQALPITRRVRIYNSPVVMLAPLIAPTTPIATPQTLTLGAVGLMATTTVSTTVIAAGQSPSPTTTLALQAPVIPVAPRFFFERNLRLGMRGDDVKMLQKFLNANGFTIARSGKGSPGNESDYYGQSTAKAVVRYQEFYARYILNPLGLKNGSGLLYGTTRQFINTQTTL